MKGNHFLVHGHKKDLPHITRIFHLLKYVVTFFVSAISHHISLLRLLPKSYFKISTFQPNFLCISSFNWCLVLSLSSVSFKYRPAQHLCEYIFYGYLQVLVWLNG